MFFTFYLTFNRWVCSWKENRFPFIWNYISFNYGLNVEWEADTMEHFSKQNKEQRHSVWVSPTIWWNSTTGLVLSEENNYLHAIISFMEFHDALKIPKQVTENFAPNRNWSDIKSGADFLGFLLIVRHNVLCNCLCKA